MNGPPKAKKQTRLATNYSFDSQIESKKMLLCFCLFQCVWKEGEKLRKTFSTSLFRNIRGLCFNEMFQQLQNFAILLKYLLRQKKLQYVLCSLFIISWYVVYFLPLLLIEVFCQIISSSINFLSIFEQSIVKEH